MEPYITVIAGPVAAALAALAAWLKAKPGKEQLDLMQADITYIKNNGVETRKQINQAFQEITDVRDALQGHAEVRDAHSSRFARRRPRTELGAKSHGRQGLPVLRPHAPESH